LADIEEAMRLAPDRPDPWFARATIYDSQRRRVAALADYRRALELAPANWQHRAAIQRWVATLERK
jgi:Tfp pilus assembly protein PilF